jgi:hypothetical protein
VPLGSDAPAVIFCSFLRRSVRTVPVSHAAAQTDNINFDVMRCEQEFEYFATRPESQDRLRRVLNAYVARHRELGYVQGMSGAAS